MNSKYPETGAAGKSKGEKSFFSLMLSYMKFCTWCTALWGIGYMRFSISWVFFGSLGLFLLKIGRSKNQGITGFLKTLGVNEKRFIMENISVRDLPSWVYFPDVERVEWFNKIIKRAWPWISEYGKKILLENVQSAVSENTPLALQPFKFINVDLGDTPPRIGGVKVYMEDAIRRDEIVMDVDIMLYSDARISFQMGKIKGGIKEFELRGTLRVIMKPLVPKVPFVGAITVCFLDSPYFDFALTDMANVLNLPGLQHTINAVLHNVINQQLVFPNRIPIALLDEIDIQRLKYPTPQGVLRINVIAAQKLKICDIGIGAKSDPYCVINVVGKTLKTAVRTRTVNPTWDAFFDVIVPSRFGRRMEITVLDQDQGNQDDLLGTAQVALDSVYDQGNIDTWLRLQEVDTGELHMNLTWFSLSTHASDISQAVVQATSQSIFTDKQLASGLLYVVVEQASHLSYVKHMKEPSAVCELVLGQDVQTTEAKPYTQSPRWDSIHQFLIYNPYVDTLKLTITCIRTNTKLGHCEIPVKQLLDEQLMMVARPFLLDAGGRDGAILQLHLQLFALKERQNETAFVEEEQVNVNEVPNDIVDGVQNNTESKLQSSMKENGDTDVMVGHRKNWDVVEMSDPVAPVYQSSVEYTRSEESNSDGQQVNLLPTDKQSRYGQVMLTLQYPRDATFLHVMVHKAENLLALDKDGFSDPYIKLYVEDRQGRIKGSKHKTVTRKNNLNPNFDEGFDFSIPYNELSDLVLHLEVKNHVSLLHRNKVTELGSTDINLSALLTQDRITDWYFLNREH